MRNYGTCIADITFLSNGDAASKNDEGDPPGSPHKKLLSASYLA
jgi:hypothetical protein